MKLYTLIVGLVTICACNTPHNNGADLSESQSEETSYSSQVESDNSSGGESNQEAIYQKIEKFTDYQFRKDRQDLIEQGEEHGYIISEIKDLGSSLKFDVTIPDIEGKSEYACVPRNGEYTITFVGEKEVADLYYNQSKVGLKWDNCNTTSSGELCDTYQDMKSEPMKTHFTISQVNSGNNSISIFKRVIMPK